MFQNIDLVSIYIILSSFKCFASEFTKCGVMDNISYCKYLSSHINTWSSMTYIYICFQYSYKLHVHIHLYMVNKDLPDIKPKLFFCFFNGIIAPQMFLCWSLKGPCHWSHRQVFRSETTESSTEKVEKVDEKKHVKPEAFEEVPKNVLWSGTFLGVLGDESGFQKGIDERMLGGGNEQIFFHGSFKWDPCSRDQTTQRYGNFEGFPLY